MAERGAENAFEDQEPRRPLHRSVEERGPDTAKQIGRLVADAFIETKPRGLREPVVEHIDGNVENNRAENLRWADHVALRVEGRKARFERDRSSAPEIDIARVRAAFPDAGELRVVSEAPGIVVDDRGRIYSLRMGSVRESRGKLVQLDPHYGVERARLIALAFHGPPPSKGAVVVHRDGNKANNTPQNLRWGDRAETNWRTSRFVRRAAGKRR